LAPLDDALTETPARPDRACASDQLQAHRTPPRRLMRPSTRARRVGLADGFRSLLAAETGLT